MVGTGTAPRPTWLGADLFPLRALVSVAVLGAHHARPPSCLTDEETGSEGTVSSPGTPSLQELGRDSGPGSANSARVLLEGPSCSPVRCPASGWSEQAPGPARGPGLNGSSVPARQLCCPAPPPAGLEPVTQARAVAALTAPGTDGAGLGALSHTERGSSKPAGPGCGGEAGGSVLGLHVRSSRLCLLCLPVSELGYPGTPRRTLSQTLPSGHPP